MKTSSIFNSTTTTAPYALLAAASLCIAPATPPQAQGDADFASTAPMTALMADNPLVALDEETSRIRESMRIVDTMTTQSQFQDQTSATQLLNDTPLNTNAQEQLIRPGEGLQITTTPTLANETGLDLLPRQLDKSTTQAQLIQLRDAERRGQIGEAFLMARELVKQFPTDEYAYDAAMRNSLVLGPGMAAATDELIRSAMVMTDNPDKYYVQFAHLLLRRNNAPQFEGLYNEYARNNAKDPECTVTLARMVALIPDSKRVIALLEPVYQDPSRPPFTSAMLQLLLDAYMRDGQDPKARTLCLQAVEMDYGAWEKTMLLQTFLKIKGIEADEVLMMLRQVSSNEQDYKTARNTANQIIETALTQRFFEPLQNRLDDRIEHGEANHIEVWLAALMAQLQYKPERVQQLLLETTKSKTPVIAYERAMYYRAAGKHNEALEILQDMLEEQWGNIDVRLQLTEILLDTGRSLEAAELLDDMTPLWVERDIMPRVAILAIKAAMRINSPEYVMDVWMTHTETAGFPEILAMGDQVYTELKSGGDPDELLQPLETRIKQPDQHALYLLKARLHQAKGEQRAALESYLDYLKYDTKNIAALRFAAQLASKTATAEIKLVGADLALPAISTANTDIAIDLYKRLIEMQPMIGENYSELMRVYQARGEPEKARRVALELSDYATTIPMAKAIAGAILADNGFATDSIPFFEQHLRGDQNNFTIWFRYAQALGEAGKYQQATQIYHNFLLKGVSGHAVNQPGILAALQTIAERSETTEEFTKFLVDQRNAPMPGKPEYLLSSAQMLMKLEKMDLATTMIAAFREQYPQHRLAPDSLLLLGNVAEAKGRPDQAMVLFNTVAQSTETLGTNAEIRARFEIGDLHRRQNKPYDAIAAWCDLKARFPEDNKAIEGLYEAGMLAWFSLKDTTWATALLKDFVAAGTTDFAMIRRAQAAIDAIAANTDPNEFRKTMTQLPEQTPR